MRIFTVTDERTLDDLRKQVQLAEANQADRHAAEAALLAANPGLAETTVTEGMTIIVPEVPKAKKEAGTPVGSATAALAGAARAALDVLLVRTRETEQQREAELEGTRAALRTARTAARRRGEPLAPELVLIDAELKAELGRRKTRADEIDAVETAWADGLDQLVTRLENRP